jgi:hypothetical protein
MLRASRLTPESIVHSMQQGNFYASSGIELTRVEYDQQTKTLNIEIQSNGDAEFTTQFIGTPIDYDATASPRIDKTTGKPVTGTLDYSSDVGKVFATAQGLNPSYQMADNELFVRATITSNKAPDNPTTESALRKAWTQPFGWRARLAQR